MINYGLKDKVALITGTNNPWGIGATTALAFACEGAKVILVYKKVDRPFDTAKTDRNGVDRYYAANAGDATVVEQKLKEMNADYCIIESDISSEESVKEIYAIAMKKYGRSIRPTERFAVGCPWAMTELRRKNCGNVRQGFFM